MFGLVWLSERMCMMISNRRSSKVWGRSNKADHACFLTCSRNTLLEALSASDFLICYVSSPQPHNHPASTPVSLGLPITQPITLSQKCYQLETSLEVQWLKFHPSTAWELVELRSCLPHSKAKINFFLIF